MIINPDKEQRRASNPLSSVWVSASAGSGKTKVLTDRVLNLLLLSGQPEKILCLTFTKTAAAQMANRINDVLKSWVTMSSEELIQALEKLTGDYPDEETINKARRLFALVLETPGGMKIMTIHSFSQSILKRFPLEANVSPHFDIIDEIASKTLLDSLIQDTLNDKSLSSSIDVLSAYLDENSFADILKEALQSRLNFIKLKEVSGVEQIIFRLKKQFNIYEYLSEDEIKKSFCNLDEWDALHKKYIYSKNNGIKQAYLQDEHAIQMWETIKKIKSFHVINATEGLLKLVYHIIDLYEQYKYTHALLDYEDLIDKTADLLSQSGNSAWVLYKLDGGIDHILVDEAQDTNPKQWLIIKKLAEEFFAGSGRSEILRTIFAVGDKKQSIFSFQGAVPDEFERMRLFFQEKVRDSQNEFETVPFNVSFRSTEPILRLVNFLLQSETAKDGVLNPHETAEHISFREMDAGLVEIWPLEPSYQTDKSDIADEWKPPIERQSLQSPVTRLAQKIVLKIKQLIDSKEILESAGRPIRAGDFLILVQRRNHFVSELVRCLKEYQIPVAGVDRLVLMNYIAIQDLIALAKFALLPEDDLNLANILKSPLLRLTEEDVYKICYNRQGKSVYQRIQEMYPQTAAYLSEIMNYADKVPPFEFFSYILSVKKGREFFEARLGNEVNEALDEFLSLLLSYETIQTPSLQNFLHWIEGQNIEIKRDLEQSDLNAVRIMTVHGSKGLQGNIVFLPDTRFVSQQTPSIFWTAEGLPLWFPKSELYTEETECFKQSYKDARMQEYRRLLYVAVTRPKDRLYICGWENKKAPKSGNWYDLIMKALPYKPDTDGIVRFSSEQRQKKSPQPHLNIHTETISELPAWATQEILIPEISQKPLQPSIMGETELENVSIVDEEKVLAMKRGTFIHRLLQYLPEIPPEKRSETIHRLNTEKFDIPDTLFQLITDENFSHLFGPSSLAEVPIVGTIDGQVISGQIDRLVILDNLVLLVDYKSNRYVPQSIEQVPVQYKKQLQIYQCLLKQIFPDKLIKTYLLWTQNLTWMEII